MPLKAVKSLSSIKPHIRFSNVFICSSESSEREYMGSPGVEPVSVGDNVFSALLELLPFPGVFDVFPPEHATMHMARESAQKAAAAERRNFINYGYLLFYACCACRALSWQAQAIKVLYHNRVRA